MDRRKLILIGLALVVSLGCVTGAELAATAVVEVPVTQTAQAGISGWLNVYFTDTHSESLRGGPDSHLATAIDQARVSVDAALYDLSLWSIRDALIAAHNRGVTVRVVVESDALEREEVQALISAGIAILSDRRESLMHHKFVVIDRAEVWTGSMNLTVNGAYGNNNNLVRLQSSQIAANYTLEFEEMFVDDLFGDASRRNDTPNPAVTLNGVQIENYFSPDDGVQAQLVALVDSAQSSVYMLAFAFTADPLADALVAARERGLTVAAVVDEDQSSQAGADFESLLSNGIPVKLDGNPRKMHHKVLIIDEQIVVLGSYNFSRSAEENNDENVLVIHSAELAAQFLAEFALILGEAK